MHVVLENAVSTLNYLLLLQATGEIDFPECVVDELGVYLDGMNQFIKDVNDPNIRGSRKVTEELEQDIHHIVVKELSEGTYFQKQTPDEVQQSLENFYNDNDFETDPSLMWYKNAVDDAYANYEAMLDVYEDMIK